MIAVSEHPGGCILPVRAQPGARKSAVLGEHGSALKVAVTSPPQDGRANKAIIEVLADALNVKRGRIELLSGATSRDKRFLIRGLSAAQLLARLE